MRDGGEKNVFKLFWTVSEFRPLQTVLRISSKIVIMDKKNEPKFNGMECVSTCTYVNRLNHSFRLFSLLFYLCVYTFFCFRSVPNWMQINNGNFLFTALCICITDAVVFLFFWLFSILLCPCLFYFSFELNAQQFHAKTRELCEMFFFSAQVVSNDQTWKKILREPERSTSDITTVSIADLT